MPTVLLFGSNHISLRFARCASEAGCDAVVIADAAQCEKVAGAGGLSDARLIAIERPEQLPLEQWLRDGERTLAISIGAPWIFDGAFLEERMGGILLNLHGTHLPRSRGGNLFSWQIMTGQRTGICLLHQMTVAVDAGAVLDCEEFIYPARCRKPADYIQHYESTNVAFLQRFLTKWLRDGVGTPLAAQPEYLSTYWPRLRADVHGWLDWTWPSAELERFICAFDDPYGGARCRWRGQEVIVRDAWAQSLDGRTHPFQWGQVTRNNGQWLNVAAQGGELLLCSVRDLEGRDLLPAIRPGDRLFSSAADLDAALRRVVKTEAGLKVQGPKA